MRKTVNKSRLFRRRIAATYVSVVLIAACGEDDHFGLADGSYTFSLLSRENNSCWASYPSFAGYRLDVTTTEGGMALVPVDPMIRIVLPTSLQATRSGKNLDAAGETVVSVSSACALAFSLSMDGRLYDDNKFDAVFYVAIDADTLTTSGQPSNCQASMGGLIAEFAPFPTLSNPTNGACSLELHGVVKPCTTCD